MKLVKRATAGTMESSDLMVTVEPAETLIVTVQSPVIIQFGDSIRTSALSVAKELGIEGASIFIDDHGALDCAIRARVETALVRASMEELS